MDRSWRRKGKGKSDRPAETSDELASSGDESSTAPPPEGGPENSQEVRRDTQTSGSEPNASVGGDPSGIEARVAAADGQAGSTPPPQPESPKDGPSSGAEAFKTEKQAAGDIGPVVIDLPILRADPIAPSSHPIFSRMRALRYVRFNHSLVFFLYAVGGAAALIYVKSLSTDLNVLLYFLAVGSIMLTYFALNMADFSGLKLRYDQLGDNLYYLGFIYTLGTLTHTLYIYDARSENIAEIISSFGIALSSTALGVILRIVAHLMRIDPNEVEDVVRIELIDLTSRVRASLDTVVRDLAVFGEQTRLVIEELRDDTSKTVGESTTRFAEASHRILPLIDETHRTFTDNTARTNALNEQMISALTALVARINAISAPADMIDQKLRPAITQVERGVEQTISALSALVARIGAIDAPADMIERKLRPAIGQIERVIESMARVTHDEEARIERLKTVTDTMNAAIGSVRDHLTLIASATSQQEVGQRIKLAANALKDMSENVVGLRDQMNRLVESETSAVTTLRSEYERAVSTIREQGVSTKQELDRFRGLTAEMQDSLIELARALRKAV